MVVRYIKAQNTKLPEDKIMPILSKMVLVVAAGAAKLSNQAVTVLRGSLLHYGYVEGEDFVLYQNNLYVLASLASLGLDFKGNISEVFNNLSQSIDYYSPQASTILTNKAKQNKISMPIWKIVVIPAVGNIDQVLTDLKSHLELIGYNTDVDYTVSIDRFYVNYAIQGTRNKDGVEVEKTFKDLMSEVSKFLHGEIGLPIPARVVNLHSLLGDHKLTSWVVLKELADVIPDLETLSKDLEVSGLGIADYEIKFNTGENGESYDVGLNRLSHNFYLAMEILNKEAAKSGKHLPTPAIDVNDFLLIAPILQEKDWRAVEFVSSGDSVPIQFKELVEGLKTRGFVENDSFMVMGNTLFVNIRAGEEFIDLDGVFYIFASYEEFNIKDYSINYNVGRKEKKEITDHWGSVMPNKFNSVGYEMAIKKYLFRLEENETREERLFRIFHSESCIDNLIKQNLRDFYATYDGTIKYSLSAATLYVNVFDAFNNQTQKNLVFVRKLTNIKDRENYVKKTVGELYDKTQLEKSKIEFTSIKDFWKTPENPLSTLTPTEDDFVKMSTALEEMEKDEAFSFYEMSQREKLNYVRKIISSLGIIPGYVFSGTEWMLSPEKRNYLYELASARKIKVDKQMSDSEIYESLLKNNGLNAVKINAFIGEFKFNLILKARSDGVGITNDKDMFLIAVDSIFHSIVQNMKTHPLFTPIPGDAVRTKVREKRYNRLVTEISRKNIAEEVRSSAEELFDKLNPNMEEFKTLNSFKFSPFYKDVIRMINVEISSKISIASFAKDTVTNSST